MHELLRGRVAEAGVCSRLSSFPFLLSTLAYRLYVDVESNHRTEQLSGKSRPPLNEALDSTLPYDRIPLDKIVGL